MSDRIRVPAPAARTRTADSPFVVIHPPRGTPSVQRVIIRTPPAKQTGNAGDSAVNTAMDNNQAVDRRRSAQASPSPLEALKQLPALVLLERIPVPTLAVLQDGTIVFANRAFADILGRDAEEVVALKFYDIFYGALETESVLSVVDGLANMVVELAHKDGSTVRALMSRTALRRAGDAIALATFQDLTEELWANER
jgi:PAS domain S-box-containing protein